MAARFLELTADETVRDRIVPHVASDEHVAELEALYPFPERMVAIYRWPLSDPAIIERMTEHGIDNVMMWWDKRWTRGTQDLIDDAGFFSWVHTPADLEVIEDFRRQDVRLYSDGFIDCPGL